MERHPPGSGASELVCKFLAGTAGKKRRIVIVCLEVRITVGKLILLEEPGSLPWSPAGSGTCGLRHQGPGRSGHTGRAFAA